MNGNGARRLFLAGWLVLLTNLAGAGPVRNVVIAPHAGDLVALDGQELVSFKSDNFLRAQYTVLYFGADWCPDCRRFSPALVAAYDHQPPGEKRFEVLLISRDKNAEGMLKFMRTEKMRWPALAFEKVAAAQDLNQLYSGHGIPCLTVLDSKGTVVLQSKDNQDANEIREHLQALLKNNAAK
jgi:nucleoredoxin